tara:strand:+ start:2685 stop:4088 length:1404 start_codon:yes stop_codon:yes gene_type:complete
MPGPSTDIGRDLVVFVDPQSAFKTAAGDFPVAADALRVVTASVNGKSPLVEYADKRGTSTALGVIDQKRTAEFSLECYAYLPARGTNPDWYDLLVHGGWQEVSDLSSATTTVSGGSSTTTQVDLASSSGFTVGGAAIIETGNGTGAYEIRRITAVDTGGTNITVTPKLQNTPAASANVKGAIMLKPKDSKDTTPDSVTLWAFNNRSADRIIGGVSGSQSISMGGDEAARMTVSGTGRQDNRMVSTTLNDSGGINSSVTSFTVSNGAAIPADASATTPYYYQMEDEVFKIIGVSGNTITTATRQSYAGMGSAAAHADGLEFYPFQPAGTYGGTPIPATSGQLVVGGEILQAGSVSVEVDQGIVYRENVMGDSYVVDGYVGGMRAVSATLDGWSFYDSTMIKAMEARERTAVSVHAQQGEAEGAILGIEMPNFYMEEPDMDRGGDEVTVSLTGKAFGSSSEDEIYMMMG